MKVEDVFRRTRRMVHAWLAYADERTLLLPDVLPGHQRGPKGERIYRPHNSGADNYPYLVATAWFTDRALYDNRLRHMLRNEVRYTTAPDGIPSDLDFATRPRSGRRACSARPSTRRTGSSRSRSSSAARRGSTGCPT